MEIPEKLVKFKVHILVALAVCVAVSTLVLVVAPRFVTILAYFWPLLLSTALFLVAVVVFGRTTPASSPAAAAAAGEGLLDYVAGEPDPLHHHHDYHDHHQDHRVDHQDHRDDHDHQAQSLIKDDDGGDEHRLVEPSTSKSE